MGKKANKDLAHENEELTPKDTANKAEEKQLKKAAKKKALEEKQALEIAKEEEKAQLKKDKKAAKKAAKEEKKALKKAKRIKAIRPKWVKKFFKRSNGKSKEQMFKYMESDQTRLLERAHTLLNIQSADYDKSFIVKMPASFDNKKSVKYRLALNKKGDKTLLYDQAFFNVLFFGVETLYQYQANIDFHTGQISNDKTSTFRYFDIVNIESNLNFDHINHPKYLKYGIDLTLSNSQKISLNLRNHRLTSGYKLPGLLTEQEKKIVSLLKQKLH
ncbi:hypothetical protein KHQ89_04355 [Mycoplasmatota bacterium]|nr:hypothetical protein KHQ89_04355 [Mycoplasmatota bacterium]